MPILLMLFLFYFFPDTPHPLDHNSVIPQCTSRFTQLAIPYILKLLPHLLFKILTEIYINSVLHPSVQSCKICKFVFFFSKMVSLLIHRVKK